MTFSFISLMGSYDSLHPLHQTCISSSLNFYILENVKIHQIMMSILSMLALYTILSLINCQIFSWHNGLWYLLFDSIRVPVALICVLVIFCDRHIHTRDKICAKGSVWSRNAY